MRDIFSADNRVTRPVGFVTTSEFRALVRLVVAFCLVRREGLTKGLITAASFLKPAIEKKNFQKLKSYYKMKDSNYYFLLAIITFSIFGGYR